MNSVCDKVSDNAILQPTAFTSKSLSSTEWSYSKIECKTLGILHGLEKFHLYCFVRKACIITNHKTFVAILIEDMVMYITTVTMHYATNTPVQKVHHI